MSTGSRGRKKEGTGEEARGWLRCCCWDDEGRGDLWLEGMDRWSWSGGENQVELGLATRWIWEDPEGNGEWVAAA